MIYFFGQGSIYKIYYGKWIILQPCLNCIRKEPNEKGGQLSRKMSG